MIRSHTEIMSRLYGKALGEDWQKACRNITFQVTECCNLSCTYCVSGDTKIRMSDFTEKKISSVKEGDEILGFSEFPDPNYKSNQTRVDRAIVTKVFHRVANHALRLTFEDGRQLVITEEHPILTRRNKYQNMDYVNAGSMKPGHSSAFYLPCPVSVPFKKDKDYKIGFMVACILGDASLKEYPHKQFKNCRITKFRFAVKDEELTNRLWDYLNEFGFNVYKKPFHISTKYDLWKDAIFSNRKDTFYGLKSLIEEQFRKNQTTSYYKGFLAGIYDCEGSVSGNTIRICNTNRSIIDEITDGLTRLGIPFVIEEAGKTKNHDKWNVRVCSFHKQTNAMRFIQSVDPATPRKKYDKYYGSPLLKMGLGLVSVQKVDGPVEVFNLETTSHTYIANGIAVHNCYQTNKSDARMDVKTAKAIVDLLFRMWDEDDRNAYIDKHTKSLVLDFIGGEPMLEVDLIEWICDYFWHEALKRKCPWADTFRISITSNGTIYFGENVQRFLRKYQSRMSFSITIDGPREMHNSCRIHHDGTGSWAEANAAQKHYHRAFNGYLGTKVTIAKENLEHLHSIFKYFSEEGYDEINANPVFEREWTVEDGKIYYDQLKQIADYLLKECDKEIQTSLFTEHAFHAIPVENDDNWCGGGTGAMLAFDTKGNAYPCIRYMPSSLNGEREPLVIGDCYTGVYVSDEANYIIHDLLNVTRSSSYSDECYNCPIASGCATCSAWNYQKHGTTHEKDMGICWMHRARCLANAYYWNNKYRNENRPERFKIDLPDKDALKIVSAEELEILKNLSMGE